MELFFILINMKYSLLLFFSLFIINLFSQTTFSTIYFNVEDNHSGYNILDKDSSLIISVYKRQAFPEMGMLKLNYEGDVEIEKFYGNPEDSLGWFSYPENMKIANNGNIVLGGAIGKLDDGFYPVRYGHLCLFDSNLDTIWTTILRDEYDSTSYPGYGTSSTQDNEYFLTGQWAYSPTGGNSNYYITKFDSIGNIVWNNIFTMTSFNSIEGLNDIEIYQDTIYASGTMDQPSNDAYLFKISMEGEVLNYASTFFSGWHNNITEIRNGEFIRSIPFGIDHVEFERFDTNLDTIWSAEHEFSDYNYFHRDIDFDWNDNIITCGGGDDWNQETDFITTMGYMARLSSDGDLMWKRRYMYIDTSLVGQAFLSCTPTSDYGFAACGRLNVPGFGLASRMWVIKTDSMGCIVAGCDSLDNSINNIDVNQQEKWFTYGPNPVSSQGGLLNIYLGYQSQSSAIKNRKLTFKLINLQGQIIKEFTSEGFGVTYMIPINGIASGHYVLSLQNGHQILQSSKLIIE